MNFFARFQSNKKRAPQPTPLPPTPKSTPAPNTNPSPVDWRRRLGQQPRQDGYSNAQAAILCAFQAQIEASPDCDYRALRCTLRVVRTAPSFCPLWAVEALYRAAQHDPLTA